MSSLYERKFCKNTSSSRMNTYLKNYAINKAMQYPRDVSIPILWNNEVVSGRTLSVAETVSYWERASLPLIKAKILRDNNGITPRNISQINKFPSILMTLLKIQDGKDAKVFHNLKTMCSNPTHLILLIEFLYDIYRNIVGNNNLPPINGFQTANCDRDVIVGLRNLGFINRRSSELYAYTIAFYLHWAQLNGSWPSNRCYTDHLERLGNPIQQEQLEPPPVIIRRATLTNRSAARNTSPHLTDSFFKYYDMSVKSNSCKAEDCTICLDPMNVSDNNLKLNECGHFFHKECLARWTKAECPICRAPTPRVPRVPQAENLNTRNRQRAAQSILRAAQNTRTTQATRTPQQRTTTLRFLLSDSDASSDSE